MTSDTIQTIVPIKNLTEKAILISLNIGVFNSNKKDKKQSAQVEKDNGAKKDTHRVYKSTLTNKKITAVSSFAQKMRNNFKTTSSPWGTDGFYILKIKNYPKVKTKLEADIREFYSLVDEAVNEYAAIIASDFAEARNDLQAGFNVFDYPSLENFKSSFYARINTKPVETSDFRSNSLSNEEISEINASIQQRIEESLKGAELEVLARINENLGHLSTRLIDSDGKFHNSSISNLCESLQEARELNINDNKKIAHVIDVVESRICGLDAANIRSSDYARKDAMNKTREAISEISDAMANFSF